MNWQLGLFLAYVSVCVFSLMYVEMMNCIARARNTRLEIKNLLDGPETLLHAIRRVSGTKYINNLEKINL